MNSSPIGDDHEPSDEEHVSLEQEITDKKSKKRKRKEKHKSSRDLSGQADQEEEETVVVEVETPSTSTPLTSDPTTSRSSKKKKHKHSHTNTNYTISIALPGSILSNAQNALLKSYLVGQIARALAIFNIDEVIIFDDYNGQHKEDCVQMARILQYLECPQYLRKFVFPMHTDLQYAGAMNPLDLPHHLRKHEILPYREGIVVQKPIRDGEKGCFVHVGLEKDVHINTKLPEGIRVTVKLDDVLPTGGATGNNYALSKKKKLTGTLVDSTLPKAEAGLYWGYNVRLASSFNTIFTQCPYGASYDLSIGTSDKGISIEDESFHLKQEFFQHLLIVFGGLHGLEFALENDETLAGNDVATCFDHYLNTCPHQGSRTIRTEEAVLISMARLQPIIMRAQAAYSKVKK